MSADTNAAPQRKPLPWPRRIAQFPVRAYQATLSWALGGHCRFTPTCSVYALDAIAEHGALKGWLLALWRLARCNPLCQGGHDPVPPARSNTGAAETSGK